MLHEVLTTERVPFTYRVAGLGSRFLAWCVDCLLMVLLGFAGVMVGLVYDIARRGVGMALVFVWLFVLMWGYFLLFEWLWHGQTPGKRLLGIRVVQWQGTGLTFYQAAVRNIVRFADALPLFYGLGFAVAACNPRSRRLGDLAAGTLVVHLDRRAQPIQALQEGHTDAELAWDTQAGQRLGQLSRPQKQTLLDLCVRRDQLQVRERARLFAAVAEHFKSQLELTPAEYQSDEKFVLHLATLLTQQLRRGPGKP